MKETLYKLLEDDQKKKLGKNNEAKMTVYNALPRKEYKRVFTCKTAKEVWHTLIITPQGNSQVKNFKIDLLTQEYKNLKSLDPDYSRKNHVRKFLCALPLKWRAKVMDIKEAKDLATLPLDELIKNIIFYEMVMDNDSLGSKTTKEKVKSLALKAKVTREQTSNDSNSQGESDEYVGEEEAEAFNLLARNFRKFFRKGDDSGVAIDLEMGPTGLQKAVVIDLGTKVVKARSKKEHEVCLKCDILLDDWIVDSSCTKHMTGNRRLFTLYKAYDGGHVVFGSNLKGKVVDGGNMTHDSITIINIEHVSGLAFNLISIESKEDILEKFKILCKKLENLHDCTIVSIITNHSSEFDKLQFGSFCKQHGMSYNLLCPFTSQSNEIVERTHRKLRKMSHAMKAYIVLNKETMRIEESLNVAFDEGLPEPKSSSWVEDNRIFELIVQDLNGSPSLQVNVLDEGYLKSLKKLEVTQ
nr:hypothetical protein [Tanacetum cinerariifolium]